MPKVLKQAIWISGRGTIVIGLAAIILGETIVGKNI